MHELTYLAQINHRTQKAINSKMFLAPNFLGYFIEISKDTTNWL